MKKILILVASTKTNKNSFVKELRDWMPEEYKIEKAYFEDIIIDIEEKNTTIFIGDQDIASYDLVYFRRAGTEFLWLAATIALYLDSRDVLYFDSTYREVGPTGTKLNSFMKLAVSGLPVIPSIFCYKGNIQKNADRIIAKLGFPMVIKDLYSQRGLGVFLAKDKTEMLKLASDNPGKKFMFQKFIDKKEEYRVLVLGDKIGSYERKTSTDPNEFRNNVSLGASEDFMDISLVSEEVKYVSIKSAKVLRIEIAGVDIVLDTDDRVWVLEVNRGPGFTYDSKESPEVENVSKFFVEVLEKTQ